MPRALKLWGVLASICVILTILLANAFPLSWIAVWPAVFSVLPIAVFLYLVSLRGIASVEKMILAGGEVLARTRRHSGDGLGEFGPSINERLEGLSRELEELKMEMEQLRAKTLVKNLRRKLTMRPV